MKMIQNRIYKLLLFKRGISLSIVLKWKCNAKCSYCLNDVVNPNIRNRTEYSSMNEILEYLSKFPLKIKQISLTGGEPSLHPEFHLLTNELLKLNYNVLIYTNLINIDKLLKIKPNKRLKIYTTYHENAGSIFESNYNKIKKHHKLIICKEFIEIEESLKGSQKHNIINNIDHLKNTSKGWLFLDTKLRLSTSCYERLMCNIKNK